MIWRPVAKHAPRSVRLSNAVIASRLTTSGACRRCLGRGQLGGHLLFSPWRLHQPACETPPWTFVPGIVFERVDASTQVFMSACHCPPRQRLA